MFEPLIAFALYSLLDFPGVPIDSQTLSSTTTRAQTTTSASNLTCNLTGIRLVNTYSTKPTNGSEIVGRLEVACDGVWGTVCDDSFTDAAATVVCASLGFEDFGRVINNTPFVPGTGMIWLDDVHCFGNESSIDECLHSPWGVSNCGHGEDVSVMCKTCNFTGIRLVNPYSTNTSNGSEIEGRLEVACDGVWGTVCDDGFRNDAAKVICASLGFEGVGIFISDAFGPGSGQIWLDDVSCTGNESSIDKCLHSPWGVSNCGHGEDVSVSCRACNLTGIRLVNSYSTNTINGSEIEGRLEVSCNGAWGTVCDGFFTDAAADVVCANLGFGYSGRFIANKYRLGTGPIWLSDVRCIGNETSFDQCSRLTWGSNGCIHSNDVAIICGIWNSTRIRLVNPYSSQTTNDSEIEGRLEIFFDGAWGTVCDDLFTDAAAAVVCANLGFGRSGRFIANTYGAGTGPIWLDDIRCIGNESSIEECFHRPWGSHNCFHIEDVSISCAPINKNSTTVTSTRSPSTTAHQGGYTTVTSTRSPSTTIHQSDYINCTYPCQNGGKCVKRSSGEYRCECAPGFTNTSCEIEINECEALPCYPFGTCTDEIDDYSCTCNIGFKQKNDTNKWCDEIDECDVNNVTCLNGGVCQDYINAFGCDCPPQGTTFFYGDLCQNAISTLPTAVTSISKTAGILSGGAEITLYGTGFDKVPPIAVTLADTNNRVAMQEPLIGYAIQTSIRPNSFVFVTPKANETLVGIPLTVVVILSGGNKLNTSLNFIYVQNPQIEDIQPRVQLATGGMQLTVIGDRLDAVHQPRMNVELVITYPNKTKESQVDNNRMCSIVNDTVMICQMPVFEITSMFFDQNSTNESNNTANRKRRAISENRNNMPIRNFYLESVWDETPHKTPLRRGRRSLKATLELLLGFIFDNYPKYEHLNKALPNVTIQVSVERPSFSTKHNKQQQEYDSSKEEPLVIQGSNLALTCSINDYDISVGTGKCNVSHLTNNELKCSPPKEASAPDNFTTLHCSKYGSEYLAVMVQIGTSSVNQNFAFCVYYKSNDGFLWWIGVCAGVGAGFVILVVIIAVSIAIHHKRRTKAKATSQVTRRKKTSAGSGRRVERLSNTESIDIDSFSNFSSSVDGAPEGETNTQPERYWSNFNTESVNRRYQVSPILRRPIAPFLSYAKRISYTRPTKT